MPETKGPYRDMPNQDAADLKKMEAEIAAEGKLSIRLPENIRRGDNLPLFAEMCEAIDPKAIVLYSLATGLLRYTKEISDFDGQVTVYTYRNPDNPDVMLQVKLPKKEDSVKSLLKKKAHQDTVVKITTKADVEAVTEKEKGLTKENQKNKLLRAMNLFEQEIQHIKDLIEKGVDKELEEIYFEELGNKRTSLKLLLDTIDDKLEEASKK